MKYTHRQREGYIEYDGEKGNSEKDGAEKDDCKKEIEKTAEWAFILRLDGWCILCWCCNNKSGLVEKEANKWFLALLLVTDF